AGQLAHRLPMDKEDGFPLAAGDADVGLPGFAGAVDHAAHHRHLDGFGIALQPALHLVGDLGAGVLGAAAGGAGDDLGPRHREAHRPQDVEAGLHFLFGVGGQGHPDGVPEALQQQPAAAHARLEQAHLVGARLGDPHMEGVVGDRRQLAVGLHHPGHVGALDGDDDVVKVELFQQADVVEGAFHHGLGHRRAVLGQDVLFQAAAVDPDADGDAPRPAGPHHLFDPVVAADVAGVDPDLVHPDRRAGQCRTVIKMDVRYDGYIYRLLDRLDAGGVGGGGAGHTQDLAAGGRAPPGLLHIALDVLHRDVEHGLHRDGVGPADGDIADLYFTLAHAHGDTSVGGGPWASAARSQTARKQTDHIVVRGED